MTQGGSDEDAALPFVKAVVRQVAHPLGAPSSADDDAVAKQVIEVLQLARASQAGQRSASERLARDLVLLSVFFQNVDLLYDHAYAGADGASRAVVGALELVESQQ